MTQKVLIRRKTNQPTNHRICSHKNAIKCNKLVMKISSTQEKQNYKQTLIPANISPWHRKTHWFALFMQFNFRFLLLNRVGQKKVNYIGFVYNTHLELLDWKFWKNCTQIIAVFTVRMWHNVNFQAEYGWLEFWVFLLLH